VLAAALERAPTDVELMYELALTVERLGQHAEMERRLRRVMELQPDHAHAHNALGYSYVERGIKLDEASTLIKRALELLPGDAFITDSLAWLEFKLGRTDLARQLLQQAYKKRPDAEIGVHLGEVLWVLGQRDEARKVWREVRERDKRNRLLASTLTRLKADL